jgi:hypothetical protein
MQVSCKIRLIVQVFSFDFEKIFCNGDSLERNFCPVFVIDVLVLLVLLIFAIIFIVKLGRGLLLAFDRLGNWNVFDVSQWHLSQFWSILSSYIMVLGCRFAKRFFLTAFAQTVAVRVDSGLLHFINFIVFINFISSSLSIRGALYFRSGPSRNWTVVVPVGIASFILVTVFVFLGGSVVTYLPVCFLITAVVALGFLLVWNCEWV